MSGFSDEYLNSLNNRLADRVEEVCQRLLPGGKRKGREWICGGIDGGPGESMGVQLVGDKVGVWNDRATEDSGRLLNLWKLNMGLSLKDTVVQVSDFLGMPVETKPAPIQREKPISFTNYRFDPPPPPKIDDDEPPSPKRKKTPAKSAKSAKSQDDDGPPSPKEFNWVECVEALKEGHIAKLCGWRGYSEKFVRYLHDLGLVGIHRGSFAFPVMDKDGKVVRCHYRMEKGWGYFPTQGETSALVIGSPEHAKHTIIAESQWDAFALLDKLNYHDEPDFLAAIITRGATSNTDFSKEAIPKMICVPQNDPTDKASKSTGRTPAEEWLHRIKESRPKETEFTVANVPEKFKDANDWIRGDGPTYDEVFKSIIAEAKNPALKGVKTVMDIISYEIKDDLNSLIGYKRRFLGREGSWVIIGPSGIGKSTFVMDMVVHASAGVTWHGIEFRRPLRTLIIQAENDTGDLHEMLDGVFQNPIVKNSFSDNEKSLMHHNLLFKQITDKTGEVFCAVLEELIRETRVDMVVVDPLLSYIGDDISQQKVASNFLRDNIGPIMQRTGCLIVLVHHTGKPPKDKKAMQDWSHSDFSYLGLGSSELVNWSRAVSVIVPTDEKGTFDLRMTKRGERSGLVNQFTGLTTDQLYIRWGRESEGEGKMWLQTKYEPKTEEKKETIKELRMQDYANHFGACITWKDALDTIMEVGGKSGPVARNILIRMIQDGVVNRGDDSFIRKK